MFYSVDHCVFYSYSVHICLNYDSDSCTYMCIQRYIYITHMANDQNSYLRIFSWFCIIHVHVHVGSLHFVSAHVLLLLVDMQLHLCVCIACTAIRKLTYSHLDFCYLLPFIIMRLSDICRLYHNLLGFFLWKLQKLSRVLWHLCNVRLDGKYLTTCKYMHTRMHLLVYFDIKLAS